ncbi:D-alanine--poly(phosphoribitol) ligase subunit DltA [Ligilactobacillus sp. WILCCON 0076]|uniref:D-alanine--D-alanyl carrier protein ligase n=1 Tax=Ligilactobacillus ubinensis TaxID=2876789 RepID=A0A9X2JLB5_9LACO|nr:D-alanine--poly(phosphoribitol) ligase subunit DltA [Ligilactobacillus ubinensis]MCP0886813.1 D-alanine--poly(phosphoribitol) ligase subunit DltA [Ligilactobacillus ubinensis]
MKNIIEQIDNWGVKSPQRLAYEYMGSEYTYGQLKQISDAVATKLLSMQLPKKEPIMVYGGQTFETIAAFLGVVKAGHAYIPVDSHSPLQRLEIIKEIAQPAACIAVESLPGIDLTIPTITKLELENIMRQPIAKVDTSKYVKQDENFYIIFTSGTTGVPKGVQISHDNLQSFIEWINTDFALDKGKTCLAQAPYSFDLSVMSLYPTLVAGDKIAVLPTKVTENFKDLFTVLPQLSINEWVSTPSFMEICLMQKTFDAKHFPELKYFLFCGEELTHKTASTLKQRFPEAKIYNTYGPTEATVAITSIEITNQILEDYTRLPIGYAKRDSQIILVDENLNQVKPGQIGEIVLLGLGVSKGYLNNEEKTARNFITIEGKSAYRTGDVGIIDENKMLLYKGRIDFQVKMHGFRIELEDVDHHLDKVSIISQATTVPKYNKEHKVSQLVAYVVTKEKNYQNAFELTQAIKRELTETTLSYMIPQRFKYVDSLPLTINGKIDRKFLVQEVNDG